MSVRSGQLHLQRALYGFGSHGIYFSQSADTVINLYRVGFYWDDIITSDGPHYRWPGLPIRCLSV